MGVINRNHASLYLLGCLKKYNFLVIVYEVYLKKVRIVIIPVSSEAKEEGFTAVILTYNRLESLYNVINRIVDTPSLARIVVVWNNQEVAPPPPSEWPKISKTLKVIKTRANILSNRSVERRIRQK